MTVKIRLANISYQEGSSFFRRKNNREVQEELEKALLGVPESKKRRIEAKVRRRIRRELIVKDPDTIITLINEVVYALDK